MGRFSAESTSIAGLLVLRRVSIGDERGLFERMFCAADLAAFGHPGVVAQANRSLTRQRGAVRGMHFQHWPHGEWKVIACTCGVVHDVVVDIRRGSPTFLRHVAVRLAGDEHLSLLVPPGLAHGFQTLSDDCEMLYFHSCSFAPTAEGGLPADDPALAIAWPLPFASRSLRDCSHPPITLDFHGIDA